jgi:hypothetical protein
MFLGEALVICEVLSSRRVIASDKTTYRDFPIVVSAPEIRHRPITMPDRSEVIAPVPRRYKCKQIGRANRRHLTYHGDYI